jgi:AcrR family transcriptional regulator
MEDQTMTPEEKIIQATIECIEQYGLQGATNRRIAAQAGVNIAAINYYFRSKETLMKRVMKTTLDNAFDWEDFEDLPSSTPQERCTAIFEDLIQGGCNFPGLTRAHFYAVLSEGRTDSEAANRLNDFVSQLAADLRQRGIALAEEDLYLAVTEITAAVILMIMVPGLFQQSTDLDLCNPEARHRFVSRLVNRLL